MFFGSFLLNVLPVLFLVTLVILITKVSEYNSNSLFWFLLKFTDIIYIYTVYVIIFQIDWNEQKFVHVFMTVICAHPLSTAPDRTCTILSDWLLQEVWLVITGGLIGYYKRFESSGVTEDELVSLVSYHFALWLFSVAVVFMCLYLRFCPSTTTFCTSSPEWFSFCTNEIGLFLTLE